MTFWEIYLISLLTLVALFVYSQNKKANVQTGTGVEKKGAEQKNGGLLFWIITGLIVAFVYNNYSGDINFGCIEKPAKRYTPQVTRYQPPAVTKEQITGTLTWHRQAGEKGKPSDSLKVVVNENNSEVLSFTVKYNNNDGSPLTSEFRGKWVESEKSYIGTWNQVFPIANGEWFLQRSVNDKVFEGLLTEKTESKPMTLELVLN